MSRNGQFADLFSGAGGFSLGLVRAGFQVALANESSLDAELTYRANILADTLEGALPLDNEPWTIGGRRTQRGLERAWASEFRSPERREDFSLVMRGGDARVVLDPDWLREWKRRTGAELDLVVAGPPCQGFSSAGSRNKADDRNSLALTAVDAALALAPKIIVIENVPGMLSHGAETVRSVALALSAGRTEKVRGSAYNVAISLLECKRFGVPQTRKRLLIVGVRSDLLNGSRGAHQRMQAGIFPSFCPVSRGVAHRHRSVQSGEHLSAQMLLSDLAEEPPLYRYGSGKAEYRASVGANVFTKELRSDRASYLAAGQPTGRSQGFYANHEASRHSRTVARRMELIRQVAASAEGVANRCRSQWLREQALLLDTDPALQTKKMSQRVLLPSEWPNLTVTSLPDDIVHHEENRVPTVRELARLQTFPDWFEFKGVRTTGFKRRRAGIFVPQYTQVANAVPPRLAFAVGMQLQTFLQLVVDDPACDFAARTQSASPVISGKPGQTIAKLNALVVEVAASRHKEAALRAPRNAAATISCPPLAKKPLEDRDRTPAALPTPDCGATLASAL